MPYSNSKNYNMDTLVLTNKAPGKVRILFDGVIGSSFFGEGITLKMLKNEIDKIDDIDDIHIDLASPGGLVDEAMKIYTYLVQHRAYVTINVIGSIASAATFLTQAGDKRIMPKNLQFMIHNSRTIAGGDKHLMRKVADLLEQTDDMINMTYEARTGLKKAEIEKMMDETTWLTADDAKKKGFIDEISDIKGREDKIEDYEERITALYEKWAQSMDEAKQNEFDNTYRIAASLIPDWQKKPEKPYANIEFSKIPYEIGSYETVSDGKVNLNGLRYLVASQNELQSKELLDIFAKRDSENRKYLQNNKISILYNGNEFLYSEKEIKMYNQQIEELGKKIENLEAQIEDRDKTIADLKESGSGSGELKAQLEAQKESNKLLQTLVDDLQAKNKERADKAADSEVEELIKSGYIKGADKAKFINEYKNNKENYDFMVNHLKSDEPRYKALLDNAGGVTNTVDNDDEEKKKTEPGKTAKETVDRFDALVGEEMKANGGDAIKAEKTIREKYPKLAEHYEYALEAVAQGKGENNNPYL